MDNLSITVSASFDLFDWAALLVSMQAGCSVDDARTVLWNTADATDTTLEDLAADVVHGTVTFYAPWSAQPSPHLCVARPFRGLAPSEGSTSPNS